jgi:hypothetical protein
MAGRFVSRDLHASASAITSVGEVDQVGMGIVEHGTPISSRLGVMWHPPRRHRIGEHDTKEVETPVPESRGCILDARRS